MKHLTEIEIWTYIEDSLNTSERKLIETHLNNCPDCQKEYQLAHLTQQSLLEMSLEVPSMRFSKNIMDRLEKGFNTAPILSNKAKKRLGLMVGFLGLFILTMSYLLPSYSSQSSIYLNDLFIQTQQILLNFLPNVSIQYHLILLSLVFAFWSLFFIDKWLFRRLLKQQN